MADFYTWNQPNSIERSTISNFLRIAEARADTGMLPVNPDEARAMIAWLRGLLDRKPSELGNPTSLLDRS